MWKEDKQEKLKYFLSDYLIFPKIYFPKKKRRRSLLQLIPEADNKKTATQSISSHIIYSKTLTAISSAHIFLHDFLSFPFSR
jgi:hypothetical protein